MADFESPQPDHYATLGLSPGATSQDIENAFHARVREHLQHSNVSDKPIRERARQVGLAYETLRDPAKRRAYDESMAAAAAAAAEPKPARKVPPLIMFTPPDTLDTPSTPMSAARIEPAPISPAAEPEPEPVPEPVREPEPAPIATRAPVEPVNVVRDTDRVEASAPLEPTAAAPLAGAAAESADPDEPRATAADAGAADHARGWQSSVPVAASTAYDDTTHDEAAMATWQPRRRSGMRRAILAGAALIIVLGIGGVLLTGVGHRQPERVQAVLPAAVTAGQAAQSGPVPGQTAAPADGSTATLAQQSAAGAATAVPTGPATAATAGIPAAARTAAPVITPPARTLDIQLPPPTPGPATAPASGAVGAAGAAATTVAAAPPPAATPAPPPTPAAPPPPPARQPTSAQPFPRWLGGGLMNSDNPGGRYQGTVAVRFTVEPNGRVSDCRPVASSGYPALDATTCSLVEQRLRFSPALNAQGQPISTEVQTSYTWGRITRRR